MTGEDSRNHRDEHLELIVGQRQLSTDFTESK